ncbi:MAG TPA: universal stress protein [Candidatus Eremiobacteraceae bacterium]|nr:universal stress protein [Candidatus Eremiobacteraceae bacterium]
MKILVAVEGTSSSEETIKQLTQYFQPPVGQFRLLHVITSIEFAASPRVISSYTRVAQEEEKSAKALLDPYVERLRKAGYTAEAEVQSGEPSEAILAAAVNWHADLIVLGSHTSSSVSRLLLGSVAYAVVRRAACSVMVLRLGSPS